MVLDSPPRSRTAVAGNVDAGKSPGRRLNRTTSEADAGLVLTAAVSERDADVGGSSSVSRIEVPPSKRLRRKTSRQDEERGDVNLDSTAALSPVRPLRANSSLGTA